MFLTKGINKLLLTSFLQILNTSWLQTYTLQLPYIAKIFNIF